MGGAGIVSSLRILFAHSRYQQRGGEDEVVDAEIRLLRERGHEVRLYQRDNHEVAGNSAIRAALQSIWSASSWREMRDEIDDFRPSVIHVHNTFPVISPSIYWAAARERIPVVQTLHNFRLLCVQAMFLRNGAVCESCLGRFPWPGVARGCYRDSRAMSAVMAGMLGVHRTLNTYTGKVTRYIALNRFCREKFIAGGLPAERVCIKPNFVDVEKPPEVIRHGALFVGRMSAEKGIDVLVEALRGMHGFVLSAIGTGPEEDRLKVHPRVRFLGRQDQSGVLDAMRSAAYLVLPSIWYENFPRTLVEAFACGLPVIASRLGAMAEIVEHGKTGLLFDPNSPVALTNALRWAEGHAEEMREMGRQARQVYEQRYTPQRNYSELIDIYKQAIVEQGACELETI